MCLCAGTECNTVATGTENTAVGELPHERHAGYSPMVRLLRTGFDAALPDGTRAFGRALRTAAYAIPSADLNSSEMVPNVFSHALAAPQ